MKELIKYCIAFIIKLSWNILSPFIPIKKGRIVFDSYLGEQYSCNPKALYEYLLQNSSDEFQYIWAFQHPENFVFLAENKNTKICKYRSFQHKFYSFTAQMIVFNFHRTNEMPSRKNQIRLQCWHGGGCYKKTGKGIGYNSAIHNWVLEQQSKYDITHYVSSSQFFTDEVIHSQYSFHGNVLNIGMPRNDMLFSPDSKKRQCVREKLNIPSDSFAVLYAPTYRDDNSSLAPLDINGLAECINKRFSKDAVILHRAHRFSKNVSAEKAVDVSDYPDMQELLIACDMLISDYSSSIWDFSFTGKPCLLYTPDLEEYEKMRGFDKDIHSWGFPVCKNNTELQNGILTFDEKQFKRNMDKHHKCLGSFENGTACKQIYMLLK